MMNIHTNILSAVFLSVLLLTACKEEKLGPLDSDGTPPGPVSNVTVENLPGGAQINYDIPGNSDLHYIKAVYQTNNETTRETKSFRDNNHLVVDGFGRIGEYEVTLVAVDRSENESDPVTVTIHPLTPPILSVYESLEVVGDFGGISVSFQNEAEGDVVISAITPDQNGDWRTAENLYTSQREGALVARGFEAESRTFGVFVRDRWDNHSDTLITEVTPLFEVELDKSLWSSAMLSGDGPERSDKALPFLWDGQYGHNDSGFNYFESTGGVFPLSFSFDLGQTAQFSRFRFWPRYSNNAGLGTLNYIFDSANPRVFEIWGSNDPAPDGSWDSWKLLGAFESVKPSGLPPGQFTEEDVEVATAGEEFIFPLDIPAVRFVRLNVRNTWTQSEGSEDAILRFYEISLWGAPQ